jgi:hypothetical protein
MAQWPNETMQPTAVHPVHKYEVHRRDKHGVDLAGELMNEHEETGMFKAFG